MVESYFVIEDPDNAKRQSRWLLRITLGRRKLLDKGLTVQDVAAKIQENYSQDMAVIFSDNNADEQVIRIRMYRDEKGEDDEDIEVFSSSLGIIRYANIFQEDVMLKQMVNLDKRDSFSSVIVQEPAQLMSQLGECPWGNSPSCAEGLPATARLLGKLFSLVVFS